MSHKQTAKEHGWKEVPVKPGDVGRWGLFYQISGSNVFLLKDGVLYQGRYKTQLLSNYWMCWYVHGPSLAGQDTNVPSWRSSGGSDGQSQGAHWTWIPDQEMIVWTLMTESAAFFQMSVLIQFRFVNTLLCLHQSTLGFGASNKLNRDK